MIVSGPDKTQPGTFYFEIWDGNDLIERVGGMPDATERDRAAERAHRRMLFPAPTQTLDEIFREIDDIDAMTDAELMAALLA